MWKHSHELLTISLLKVKVNNARNGDDKMVQEKQSSTRYPNVSRMPLGYRLYYYLSVSGQEKKLRKKKRIYHKDYGGLITLIQAREIQKQLQEEADNSVVTDQDSSLTLAELISKYIETNIYDPLQNLEDSTNEGYKQKLENIKKLLRQGKIDTIKYYRENPTSFAIVKGTDLIGDYIKDIETLLEN